MEGRPFDKFEAWFVPNSHGESDDEEVLSFRDLPDTESARLSMQWEENLLRDLNAYSSSTSDQQDFEFDRSNSMSNAHDSMEIYCPADDLFYKGHLLPLWSSLRSDIAANELCVGFGNGETYGYKDKPNSCRTRSLNSRNSRGSHGTDRSNYYNYYGDKLCSQRGSLQCNSLSNCAKSDKDKTAPGSYSDVTGLTESKRLEKRLPKDKSCMKWQYFTLGLLKTPQMRLEDMRTRQRIRPNHRNYPAMPVDNIASHVEGHGGNVAKKSVFRRSFSSKEKYINIFRANHQKSKSTEENNLWNMGVDASRSSKGWRMLLPLSTSINGCRASPNSVVNCSTKKCDQSRSRRTAATNLPVFADKGSAKSCRRSCNPRCFPSVRGNFTD